MSQLFDTSPIEDEDGKKRKKPRRKAEPSPDQPHARPTSYFTPHTVLASIDGHYSCDRCGLTKLDLLDIRKADSGTKWLVSCGWWCLHSWLVDPIPGLLDAADRKADVFLTKIFRATPGSTTRNIIFKSHSPLTRFFYFFSHKK